jgi:DNA polymerase I-like protein with 3'-5' exonuclease and polymerase domains
MAYMAFDNETETHHGFKRKSNPFLPDNYIVMRGRQVEGQGRNSWDHFKSKDKVTPIIIPDNVDVLYGFNIKFDLLYEMMVPGGYEVIKAFINRGGKIWDGQYAKYLVEGQLQKYQICAMDDIIEEYGGTKKIDGVKALWQAGVLTSEIDPDLLLDYLVGSEAEHRRGGDIGNTILICEGTREQARKLNMFTAIERRMDGLMATTEMEYRGLKIDIARAKKDMAKRMAELAVIQERLAQHVSTIPAEVKFNWGSGTHVSCLLFGGTIKYEKQDTYVDPNTGQLARLKATARWPLFRGKPVDPAKLPERGFVELPDGSWRHPNLDQDRFQSGKKSGEGKFKSVDVEGPLKVKYQDFFYELPRMTEPEEEWKTALTDGMGKPVYSTDKDTVEELGVRDIPFLKDFAMQAKLEKDLGTYYARWHEKKKEYVGMLTCVDPVSLMVHHSLNHTSTVTTRLSSSNPNMQNIPRGDKSEVKAMFVSRFGAEGRMLEIDYSQLEVVVQGLLSLDPQLVKDLNAKIDFHCKRVSAKFGISYEEAVYKCKSDEFKAAFPEEFKTWKNRRTGVKEFSFQRAYGAGAAAIAFATGMPIDDVKALIENEDIMYPGITRFNDRVSRDVQHSAKPFRDGERGWKMYRRGQYQAPTGTIYKFRSWDAPAFMAKQGITDTFSPPEMKNYPVQGTGGELVQLVLGMLLRTFYKRNNWNDRAFLVNTVHDCVWIDCHISVYKEVGEVALKVMQAIPQYLKHFYNIDCPVPFPAEAEAGLNMLELNEHLH